MVNWYLLKDKVPVPCEPGEWRIQDIQERIVGKTVVGNDYVSTVFLGLDHNWGGEPPALFETMISYANEIQREGDTVHYRGGGERTYARYSTWEEAAKGHCEAVRELTATPRLSQ